MLRSSPGVLAANALTARWVDWVGDRRANFVVSGAAVWPLLAVLAAAADGPARGELEHAVGLPLDGALAGAHDVVGVIARSAGVHGAIGVWVHEDIPLRIAWTSALPLDIQGRLRGVASQDQATLDAWVKEHTHGILDHLPVPLDAEPQFLLAACLAIRTSWQTPFKHADFPHPPSSGSWAGLLLHRLSGTFEDLDRVGVLDTELGAMTVFESSGADDIDVHLIIGPENQPPSALLRESIAALTEPRAWRRGGDLHTGDTAPGLVVVEETSDDPFPSSIHVNTVAFEANGDHDLLQRPDLFGLRAARQDRFPGNFPGITDRPLAIRHAVQSARATFSATGFEAAAVTSMRLTLGVALRPRQHTVRVIRVAFDRPFGFLAVERLSRLVLFAGWVEDPARHPDSELYEALRRRFGDRIVRP